MTEYIKTIRKMVGHAPVLVCGASVIVVNKAGELLLQKRRDNGCWCYHGGSVELGDVVEEAAKRELFEETGLNATSLELFGVFSGPDLQYVYPHGDEVSIIDIVYICRDWTGEIRPDLCEVDELRFFAPDRIPDNISPPIVRPLKAYIEKYGFVIDSNKISRKVDEGKDHSIPRNLIKTAAESDFEYLLDLDPFRRGDLIRHAIDQDECYIAVYDGVIKGFAIMNYSFFSNAFIELLMVAEKDRRCGVGTALLDFLFAVCNTPKLFTSTNKSNEPMQKLLGKTGFTFCGQIDALDEGDPELFYVKQKTV